MLQMSLLNKPVVETNARDMAKLMNKAACKSKELALEMVSEAGIRGNVKARDVIRMSNDDIPGLYTESGELTKKGVKEMINTLRHMFKLNSDKSAKKITCGQLINKYMEEVKNASLDVTI